MNIKILLLLLLAVIASSCGLFFTPVEMTYGAIYETFVRIDIYAKQNNKIPETLIVLPKRDNHENRIVDGWNRKLIYKVDDTAISLTSLGKDGIIGGKDENLDITISYYRNKPDGSLWVGQELWIPCAEISIPEAGIE